MVVLSSSLAEESPRDCWRMLAVRELPLDEEPTEPRRP